MAGQITNAQGAQSAHLSIRQFQRLKARYRTEGVRGLRHCRRGQPFPRALPRAVQARVAALVQSVYRDVTGRRGYRALVRTGRTWRRLFAALASS